jgi:polyisoprenyl-phosphate glycosyltransferase
MGKKQTLSVVVPCYNEEEVLPVAHDKLTSVLRSLTEFEYEIIYVDDGSRDRTGEILHKLQTSDPHVRVLRLSRNFGHQIAATAGLDVSDGDAVVLIDADLQDPPEVIPEMIARWKEGCHVAYGQRRRREGETAFKLFTAKLFYRLFNSLTSINMPLDTGDFRLMDRRVVRAIRQMPEYDRFLRGMVSWIGFRQVAVPYHRAARAAGKSKYPFFKMLRFACDAIFSFSLVPLRLAMILGFLGSGIALLGIFYAIVVRLGWGYWVSGWASLFIAILFLGGIQLVCMGVIGEYIGRVYREAKHRPLYLLMECLGFAETGNGGVGGLMSDSSLNSAPNASTNSSSNSASGPSSHEVA